MLFMIALTAAMSIGPAGIKTGQLLGLQSSTSCKCVNGLFDIDVDSGEATLIDNFVLTPSEGALAVGPDGTVYSAFAEISKLVVIDPLTAELTEIGDFGFDDVSGLAFSPTGILYGYDAADGKLIVIDPETGQGTSVGDVPLVGNGGLAFSSQGVLYAVSSGAALWTIDTDTAETSFIGLLGDGIFGEVITTSSGLEFIGDTAYASGFSANDGYRALYTVDPTTGDATAVGLFDPQYNESSMAGLGFLPGPGDADRDGDADLNDYARFQDCLTGPINDPDGDKLPVECQFLDTDKDRDVDLHDFAAFQAGFTGPNEG